ncbi:MAG: hypothetical protein Q8L45_14680 [Xanthomonadaceae bacterium]|nr:hypothetical protein [Xanthomonadaceae bacterium]MDP2186052.1 hypothetical protein [Xanthomonadales bacterium]MDZ4116474.1 hypothetical protein [Xanthomonadaceae bacterium]MDZ4377080.1 hypothetical protein [Xanthomonadaceae bacterium]
MRLLACLAFMAWLPCLASCAPQDVPENHDKLQGVERPAAVPIHVLTVDTAGSFTATEQGDFIDIRLQQLSPDAGTWQLLRQSGSGRVEALGAVVLVHENAGTTQVFHFRAERVGSLELVFVFHTEGKTPRPDTVVAFDIAIK